MDFQLNSCNKSELKFFQRRESPSYRQPSALKQLLLSSNSAKANKKKRLALQGIDTDK